MSDPENNYSSDYAGPGNRFANHLPVPEAEQLRDQFLSRERFIRSLAFITPLSTITLLIILLMFMPYDVGIPLTWIPTELDDVIGWMIPGSHVPLNGVTLCFVILLSAGISYLTAHGLWAFYPIGKVIRTFGCSLKVFAGVIVMLTGLIASLFSQDDYSNLFIGFIMIVSNVLILALLHGSYGVRVFREDYLQVMSQTKRKMGFNELWLPSLLLFGNWLVDTSMLIWLTDKFIEYRFYYQ